MAGLGRFDDTAAATRATAAEPPQQVRGALGIGGIVAVVVLVAFAPVWNCEFVNWDDLDNLVNNPQYRGFSAANLRWMFTTVHGGPYQPLSWVTFAFDYALWGMQPRGYHVTNLVFHMANAVLVYALALALLSRQAARRDPSSLSDLEPRSDHRKRAIEETPAAGPPNSGWLSLAAAVAALCFAIHPLRVESVAWVTERRDVLSGFFLLLTLLAYLRMVDAGPANVRRTWFTLALVSFVLSLLSKAAGMTLPVVLLGLDVYPLRRFASQRDTARRILVEKLPFLVLGCAAMVVAARGQIAAGQMRTLSQYPVAARAMQAAYGLMFYLWKTAVPLRLSPLYPLRPDFNPAAPLYLLCGLGVVATTVVLIWARRRWPWALSAWACYVVIVSPVVGFVQSGPQIAADRYTYLACLPWALLAGAAVSRIPSHHRRSGAVVMVAIVVMLAALTFRQTRVWTNGVTLWDHALRVDPANYVASVNRGWLQMHRGDLDGALAYYEAALRSNPRCADAYRNRGFVRHTRGDLRGAIADYTASLAIDPTHAITYFNRGLARDTLGDADGAIADYSVALQARAPNPQAYSNRAQLRRQRGDVAGAIADDERALQVAPPDWPSRAQVEDDLRGMVSPH